MKNKQKTIRQFVMHLNNKEEDGGFWLPNIQRPFVWTEDQICRLFDSILREYPISTLLVWKTQSSIRSRKFIDNWKPTLRLSDFFIPENTAKKCLVLDGQQRLQSLYIGLCGSYAGKELYFDVLSGEVSAPDDIKYQFRFIDAERAVFPWVKFKDLVFSQKNKRELMRSIQDGAGRPLADEEVDKLEDHLDLVDRTFKMEDTLAYQELDSIDAPSLYQEDDVVEVFIRANSGGTKLGKSDLLFSLLSAQWEVATDKMEDLLESLNRHGFAFDRDFVLKTALVLLGQGARYEVPKFRRPGVREAVEDEWERISEAIRDVLDFVRGKTYIQCDRALPSYLVLIPLAYLRFKYPSAWQRARNVDAYLLRCSLAGAFSGQPDNLLDAMVKKLDDIQVFDVDELFAVVRSQGRSLEITEDRLWEMGYGSDTIHLIFNLWYRDFNHTPAYDNNLPQIDHIFPQSALKRVKILNEKSGRRDLMKYREYHRHQLANCMLLTREENGNSGKSDTLPSEWLKDKTEDYLERHIIPRDPSLWHLERFDDFIVARKMLLREKLSYLLLS